MVVLQHAHCMRPLCFLCISVLDTLLRSPLQCTDSFICSPRDAQSRLGAM
jgi:hypothetical protein